MVPRFSRSGLFCSRPPAAAREEEVRVCIHCDNMHMYIRVHMCMQEGRSRSNAAAPACAAAQLCGGACRCCGIEAACARRRGSGLDGEHMLVQRRLHQLLVAAMPPPHRAPPDRRLLDACAPAGPGVCARAVAQKAARCQQEAARGALNVDLWHPVLTAGRRGSSPDPHRVVLAVNGEFIV